MNTVILVCVIALIVGFPQRPPGLQPGFSPVPPSELPSGPSQQ